MIPIDPAIFLHPAEYHGGGVPLFPTVVFAVGISLFAFGAWELYRVTSAEGPERSEPAEDATDSATER